MPKMSLSRFFNLSNVTRLGREEYNAVTKKFGDVDPAENCNCCLCTELGFSVLVKYQTVSTQLFPIRNHDRRILSHSSPTVRVDEL